MDMTQIGKFKGEIIFIGGVVQAKHRRSSGSVAKRIMREFYSDSAIISADVLKGKASLTGYD